MGEKNADQLTTSIIRYGRDALVRPAVSLLRHECLDTSVFATTNSREWH